MKRIYKYPLKLTDEQTLMIPDGAKALTVQLQGDVMQMWCEVDPSKEPGSYAVEICATRHETSTLAYLATVQQGPFVWHVFTSMERSSP